ncbi:MAG: PBP1A family penicillin-binding protein [Candidatus Coatesbacteria bacterium]|nr:PBP1A family penicillin-binding protein [Candidatus Coatesbacteria bacterium]
MVTPEKHKRGGCLIKVAAWCIAIIVFLIAGVGAFVYYKLSSDLPSIEILDNFRPSLASLVYDDKGEKVHEFYIERRIWTPIDDVPPQMLNAIIAVEDTRFYAHGGVDWLGIIRAAWANFRKRSIKQGASTITQQLARLLFLTSERTIERKIREAILARQIEDRLPKKRILEYYLNEIYLGSGAYGVSAAAQTYFGKPLRELSLPQFALLAGLPRAPSRYSPFNNPGLARERRDFALNRMLEEGFITGEQCREAIASPLNTADKADPSSSCVGAWYFEHIRRTALDVFRAPSEGPKDDEEDEGRLYGASASDVIYRNGLNIYSTVNMKLQAIAERAVDKGLRELDKRMGFRGPLEDALLDGELKREDLEPGILSYAAVQSCGADSIEVIFGDDIPGTIDKKWFKWALNGKSQLDLATGAVIEVKVTDGYSAEAEGAVPLALEQPPVVEGALVAIDLNTGDVKAMAGGRSFAVSEFNRAVQSRRQPGSAFKPVIYTAAIDSGMIPTDIILDVPVYVDEVEKIWKPQNYGERVFGPVTLQTAIEKSKNLATINLIKRLSPELAVEYARLLGIKSHLEPVPSLALGSIGVSLLELTSLYGVIATGGKRFDPVFMKRITDHSGAELFGQKPQFEQIISPMTAYVMIHMLKGVIQRGTGIRAKGLGHNLAGKTGTSNDFIDAWFIGFSPDLVVGAWVGFDELKPIGQGESGARAALPIWIEFMKGALEDQPETDFPVPDGIVFRLIDADSGELATERTANAILEAFVGGAEPIDQTANRPQRTRRFSEIDIGL